MARSNPPLSAAQMADTVNAQGGATFRASDGSVNDKPGFLVAHEGTDRQYPDPLTAKHVLAHAQDPGVIAKMSELASSANTGWWKDSGTTEGNVTEHIGLPLEARRRGITQKQEATFANPGTLVRPGRALIPIGGDKTSPPQQRPARRAEDVGEPYGVEILNNMRDIPFNVSDPKPVSGVRASVGSAREYAQMKRRLRGPDEVRGARTMIIGLNDVDPEYRMLPSGREGDSEYSNYEVKAQQNALPEENAALGGQPIALQDVLNTINRGRVRNLRQSDQVVFRKKRGGVSWPESDKASHPPTFAGPERPTDVSGQRLMSSRQRQDILSEGTRYNDSADPRAKTTKASRTAVADRRLALHWNTT